MRAACLALVLALTGCTNTAERRLLIIKETQIVLKHSVTEPAFATERGQLELHLQEEVAGE